MKSILMIALLFVLSSVFAGVEPAAMWNGDFDERTKGAYTLSENGNTVANDGSSILITSTKGVSIVKDGNATIGNQESTVIIKYTNYAPPANDEAQVMIMNHTANQTYRDFIGAAMIRGGNIHGIWQNTTWGTNKTTSGAYDSSTDDVKTFAFAWAQTTSPVGAYFWIDGASRSGWGALHGTLQIDGIWIGGPNESQTLKPAANMKILAIAVFDTRIPDEEIAAFRFPEPTKKVEPLLLVNFHKDTPVKDWFNYTQNGGGTIPTGGATISSNGVSFATITDRGNFFNNNWTACSSDYEKGSYVDIFGGAHETVGEELKTSLGLDEAFVFDSRVYKTGLMNGGTQGHEAAISGLTSGQKYVVYLGFGLVKDVTQNHGFTLASSGCASVDACEYVMTEADGASAGRYQTFALGTALRPDPNEMLLVRLKGVEPTEDGRIVFTMSGERGGVNLLAVAKLNGATPQNTTIEIAGDVAYADLPTEGYVQVTLKLKDHATVTFDNPVTTKLVFTGAHDLKVKGAENLSFANVVDTGVTGRLTYETAGAYTADADFLNAIKTAGTNRTFVFTGAGEQGATLRFSTNNTTYLNQTLSASLVFDGGTHTLEVRNESQALNFGAGATADRPTIHVKRGTLNFSARNLCGWGPGAANANGIVRVDEDAALNLIQVGGTMYWNQQFYLMPGATLNHREGAEVGSGQANVRILGGANENACQIYVPASSAAGKAAKFTTTRAIEARNEGGVTGLGLFVGKNSKLEIEGGVTGPSAVRKYGAGTLAINGMVSAENLSILSGRLAGPGVYSGALTIADAAALELDAKSYVTATGTLVLPKNVRIEGVFEHEMIVIKVPAGFDSDGIRAISGEKEFDLERTEANELRLLYLRPPTRGEGTELDVAPSKAGGVSESVSIVVPGLNEGDYAGRVTYRLVFASGETIDGVKDGETLVFALPGSMLGGGEVYRGQLVAVFDVDSPELALGPVAIYQGERQYVMTEEGIVIKKATTISDAKGCTIKPVYEHPDYVEHCDSEYTVRLTADEAVDASTDEDDFEGVQGGVRIARVNGHLRLQVITKTENGAAWTDLVEKDAETGVEYVVTVKFHYAKDEKDEQPAVTYALDKSMLMSENPTAKAKISEIFISDGTHLSGDLTGLFELDRAVVVDIEIDPEEMKELQAKTREEAEALAARMVVKIGAEVAKIVGTDAEKIAAYRSYLKVKVVETNGQWHAVVDFADDEATQKRLRELLEKALEKVVSSFSSDPGMGEIVGIPGIYYGVKSGEDLKNLRLGKLKMAGADGKVSIEITRPAGATKQFYRIVCSPNADAK